jgi:hypothetical protein
LVERLAKQHPVGSDHAQRAHGVVRPFREVGAWRRLVQHRDAAACDPDALHHGGDQRGRARQNADRLSLCATACG